MNDVTKRNLYNKLENLIKNIKLKLNPTLEQAEKEQIIKYITLVLLIIKMDNVYKQSTNKSGLISILKIFGIEDKVAEKIKNIFNNGADITFVSLLIYKNIK